MRKPPIKKLHYPEQLRNASKPNKGLQDTKKKKRILMQHAEVLKNIFVIQKRTSHISVVVVLSEKKIHFL